MVSQIFLHLPLPAIAQILTKFHWQFAPDAAEAQEGELFKSAFHISHVMPNIDSARSAWWRLVDLTLQSPVFSESLEYYARQPDEHWATPKQQAEFCVSFLRTVLPTSGNI